MSVCHCKYSAQTPGKYTQTVDHYKWLEPRRMTSVRDRWSFDHTDAYHFAYFNGVGYESTENDWVSAVAQMATVFDSICVLPGIVVPAHTPQRRGAQAHAARAPLLLSLALRHRSSSLGRLGTSRAWMPS